MPTLSTPRKPVYASDLRTHKRLRVFLLPDGGSVAVCNILNIGTASHLFICGDYKVGFTLYWEGTSYTFRTYGEATEAFHNAIVESRRQEMTKV
jgi:hypothetical protein